MKRLAWGLTLAVLLARPASASPITWDLLGTVTEDHPIFAGYGTTALASAGFTEGSTFNLTLSMTDGTLTDYAPWDGVGQFYYLGPALLSWDGSSYAGSVSGLDSNIGGTGMSVLHLAFWTGPVGGINLYWPSLSDPDDYPFITPAFTGMAMNTHFCGFGCWADMEGIATSVGPRTLNQLEVLAVHAPEPASLVLLGTGLIAVARRLRRTR